MNDTQANNRQTKLLEFLSVNSPSSRSKIEDLLKDDNVSRITIIRDLNHLVSAGLIERVGGGKYLEYRLKSEKELLIPIDLEKYFSTITDARKIKYPTFNFSLINRMTGLFSKDELEMFEQGKDKLRNKFASLDKTILKRELERFTIELSWKSSQIEGNTYSLLETEELIKNKKEAKGHNKSEATMILNHKTAFDTILEKRESFKEITVADIRMIHRELVRELNVKSGIRESAVGIIGTKYLPLDNKWQIEEALNKLIVQAKKIKSVPEKALIFLAVIAYLQPFTDGNKRTSRMISNAILMVSGYYPLSYRSVDEVEYKKALILFYEQNNLYHLKRIFLEQQRFAIENYFL